MLSFLSPCVLPLVPAFLVDMAGEAALAGTQRARTLAHALAFVLGFSALFTTLWVAVALVGALSGEMVFWLQRAGGLLLVVLGMQMLGLIRIPLLARELDLRLEGRSTGRTRSFLIGVAFGVGFTPCVGPYLALILDLLLNQDVTSGAIALASLAALLWPALPFNRQFTGPTGVGVIRAQIENEGASGRIGASAPDFEYNAPGGSVLRLSDHRGKVVVVNFWATWCLPCRQEMPALQRVASGEPDVVFLEVDLQESGDRARSFMDQLGLDRLQPILDTDGATTRRFGVLSLPSTFFVDRSGVVRHLELGGPLSDD